MQNGLAHPPCYTPSRYLTLLLLPILLIAGTMIWVTGWNHSRTEVLDYPAQSAARLVERHLYFYEGFEQESRLRKNLYHFLFGGRADVLRDAYATYTDVLQHFSSHPERATPWSLTNTRVRLIVLMGEQQQWQQLEEQLRILGDNPEEAVIAEAIRFAYGLPQQEIYMPEIYTGLKIMPNGWAKDKLRLRIYQQAKLSDQTRAEQILLNRGMELRNDTFTTTLVVAGTLLLGLSCLVYFVFYQKNKTPWHARVYENQWSFEEGISVFIRAAAIGLACMILLGIVRNWFNIDLLVQWSALITSIPMLWIIYRYLLKPRGLNFVTAFGLQINRQTVLPLLAAIFIVALVERSGALLISWASWALGYEAHWSEGLSERWIWGPWDSTLLSSINTVAWAPLFEEIGFRGLLYFSLRTRLRPLYAAILSAGVFSLLHPYSLPGFLAVFWSGLVWAYAFERFRSLLPGMFAHALGNLLAVSMMLIFYR
jgi:membrane protease YdiL (CAAX protease family)